MPAVWESCLALGSSRGKRETECKGVTWAQKPPGISIASAALAGGSAGPAVLAGAANSSKVCLQLSREPRAEWQGSREPGFIQAGNSADSQRDLCVFFVGFQVLTHFRAAQV